MYIICSSDILIVIWNKFSSVPYLDQAGKRFCETSCPTESEMRLSPSLLERPSSASNTDASVPQSISAAVSAIPTTGNISIRVYVYMCMYVFIYVTYTSTIMYTYTYAYVSVHMCIYVCIYTHYTHTIEVDCSRKSCSMPTESHKWQPGDSAGGWLGRALTWQRLQESRKL